MISGPDSGGASARGIGWGARRPRALGLAAWLLAVLALNLVWYGWVLSFPLLGEDAAANYSSLVETARSARLWPPTFPVKWLEGLGQPSVFVTLTFDPFSWLGLSNLSADDALRLSYVLRASVCWLTTYLFIVELFSGARGIAVASAWLNMAICFLLTHPWGEPTFAGTFTGTQAAIFPAGLWIFVRVARSRALVTWQDAALAAVLALFLLSYPVASLLGLIVLFTFALSVTFAAARVARASAGRATAKLVLISAALFFAPGVGLSGPWSAVGAVSARVVFARELATYPRVYWPPLFWHNVPVGLRIIVLVAASLLATRQSSRAARAITMTLIVMIGGEQLATVSRSSGILSGALEGLPRPFYVEYYLAVFYAAAAGYALCRWRAAMLRVPESTAAATGGIHRAHHRSLAWRYRVRGDFILVALAWIVPYFVRFGGIPGQAPFHDYLLVLPLILWVWSVASRASGLGRSPRLAEPLREWVRVATASTTTSFVVAFFAGIEILVANTSSESSLVVPPRHYWREIVFAFY